MNRMHRAAGILPILMLALAACAAPGTGGGRTDTSAEPATSPTTESSTAPSGSATVDADDASETEIQRVDIGVLAEDPAAFEGQPVAVLARVDEILVDGLAFVTSPSGTEEGRFPVVLTGDAQVDKEIQVGSVLWLEGMPVAFTAEDLEAAGVEISADELEGLEGEFAFVASSVGDPLSQAADDDAG